MLFTTDRWRSSSAVVRRRLSLSVAYSTISPSEYRWSWKRLASATLGGVVCCPPSAFLFFFLLLSLFFFLPSGVSFKCVLTSSWLYYYWADHRTSGQLQSCRRPRPPRLRLPLRVHHEGVHLLRLAWEDWQQQLQCVPMTLLKVSE